MIIVDKKSLMSLRLKPNQASTIIFQENTSALSGPREVTLRPKKLNPSGELKSKIEG